MKYKIGDLVRIKSKAWWDRQPKDKDGDIALGNTRIVYFTKHTANECCGKVGRIERIDCEDRLLPYRIVVCDDFRLIGNWFNEDWFEGTSIINIHLKQLKGEI